jgi:ABC-type cobalamin/Fe3+-siderophores transport system ATPase subunit
MLEAKGLTKRYLRHAVVDAVSFRVAPGEVLGYLGPNGSGKSTTVKLIVGLIEPSEGQALYRGRNIREDMKWFQSPGKTDLKSSWPLFVAGYVAYVGAFSFIEIRLQVKPLAWVGFAAVTVLVKVALEWYRRLAADEFALVFDERAEPAVRTLDLAQ